MAWESEHAPNQQQANWQPPMTKKIHTKKNNKKYPTKTQTNAKNNTMYRLYMMYFETYCKKNNNSEKIPDFAKAQDEHQHCIDQGPPTFLSRIIRLSWKLDHWTNLLWWYVWHSIKTFFWHNKHVFASFVGTQHPVKKWWTFGFFPITWHGAKPCKPVITVVQSSNYQH